MRAIEIQSMTVWLASKYFVEGKEACSGKKIWQCKRCSAMYFNKSKFNFTAHLKSKHETIDFDKEYQNYLESATFNTISAITPIQNADSLMMTTITPSTPPKRQLRSQEESLSSAKCLDIMRQATGRHQIQFHRHQMIIRQGLVMIHLKLYLRSSKLTKDLIITWILRRSTQWTCTVDQLLIQQKTEKCLKTWLKHLVKLTRYQVYSYVKMFFATTAKVCI
ncbi:Hypothetical_protein [Hexamita inflata]|uniref:Hypothetical_protein n=1 Tax=Hexamita inflata TaxID=28002 RepID=A0AA86R7M1_9EUKA|nr:Hypothetical protein HINF_LOCUS55388 [Hexamita inflata]